MAVALDLADIQGNILSAYGKLGFPKGRFITLHVDDPAGGRKFVNALLPGGTDTPASITNAPGAGPEVLAFVEGLHALKRMARPEEIARSALYLASDASSFATGIALLADGGVSINRT